MRRLLVLLVAVLGLAASGHRPAPPTDPALAAWLAMGGTLAELCGGDGGAAHAGGNCDACLAGSPALAAAGFSLAARPAGAGVAQGMREDADAPLRAAGPGQARGPPRAA